MNSEFDKYLIANTHLKTNELRDNLTLKNDLGYYDIDFIGFISDFCAHFGVTQNRNSIKKRASKDDISIAQLRIAAKSKVLFF